MASLLLNCMEIELSTKITFGNTSTNHATEIQESTLSTISKGQRKPQVVLRRVKVTERNIQTKRAQNAWKRGIKPSTFTRLEMPTDAYSMSLI